MSAPRMNAGRNTSVPIGRNDVGDRSSSIHRSARLAVAALFSSALVVAPGDLHAAPDDARITIRDDDIPGNCLEIGEQGSFELTVDSVPAAQGTFDVRRESPRRVVYVDHGRGGLVVIVDLIKRSAQVIDGHYLDGHSVHRLIVDSDIDDNGPCALPTAPAAVIDARPDPASCGETVTLDGSGSFHTDDLRNVVDWRWDVDSSDGVDFNLPDDVGPIVEHQFTRLGVSTVTLQVTDDNLEPQTGSATRDVVVANRAPVADAGGPYPLVVGDELSLDGGGSFDLDGACGDSIVAYEWYFEGDGVFDLSGPSPTVAWIDLAAFGWNAGDVVSVALVVADQSGATDTATTTIELLPEPEICLLGPDSEVEMVEVPGGISFPATSVVVDDIVLSDFSDCVPATETGSSLNLTGVLDGSISLDGGSTTAPYSAPLNIAGFLSPILLGDPAIYVGSASGATDPVGGLAFELLAAPTVFVGGSPEGPVVVSMWELAPALRPEGSTTVHPSEPGVVILNSPPPATTPTPCPTLDGDFNLDGTVDQDDLVTLAVNWQQSVTTGPPYLPGDVDLDGNVDEDDLLALGVNWQRSCP